MSERHGTLLVGLGSPLMGDDGLGLVALARLREEAPFDPPVELVDGGTWGMRLLPMIETAERLVVVDAIKAGGAPGTLVVLERGDLPSYLGHKLSPHQIDLREVLALAELRGTLPDEIVALGLEPERVELGYGLSPTLEAALDRLVDAVLDRLATLGHRRRAGVAGHA